MSDQLTEQTSLARYLNMTFTMAYTVRSKQNLPIAHTYDNATEFTPKKCELRELKIAFCAEHFRCFRITQSIFGIRSMPHWPIGRSERC